MELERALAGDTQDMLAVGEELDALTHRQRVDVTRVLSRQLQAILYAKAAHQPPLLLDAFVPPGLAPFRVVNHVGTNNLALARAFTKALYRLPDGAIGGRNVQPFSWLTGHGYFTVRGSDDASRGAVMIDYVALPKAVPQGWPLVVTNERFLSYFVYRGMKDYMRRVAQHVSVGRAVREGRDMPNYFVLVREDACSEECADVAPAQVA